LFDRKIQNEIREDIDKEIFWLLIKEACVNLIKENKSI
jgi:hypothetical protein